MRHKTPSAGHLRRETWLERLRKKLGAARIDHIFEADYELLFTLSTSCREPNNLRLHL